MSARRVDDDDVDDDDEAVERELADRGAWATRGPAEGEVGRGLALGFLAMLPLFVIYELSVRAGDGRVHNSAERLCFEALRAFPELVPWARVGALACGTVVALVICFRRRVAIVPGCARIFLEGLFGAVLLGPLMALAMRVGRSAVGPIEVRPGLPEDAPELHEAGFALGGAAYEELVFRVFLYGLCFLLVRRALRFLGPDGASHGVLLGADLGAIVLSSLAFAAFHLRAFSAWLAPGGEEFQPIVFTWRLVAGILLALLFRWRGPGVAAWTHGLFNVAVVIGAGPEILL